MAYINGQEVVSVVRTEAVAVGIEVNPVGTPTDNLETIKIGNTIYLVGKLITDTEIDNLFEKTEE